MQNKAPHTVTENTSFPFFMFHNKIFKGKNVVENQPGIWFFWIILAIKNSTVDRKQHSCYIKKEFFQSFTEDHCSKTVKGGVLFRLPRAFCLNTVCVPLATGDTLTNISSIRAVCQGYIWSVS